MRAVLAVVALALLAGCKTRVVTEYVTVEVERRVYVPVPAALTNPHPIAEGPRSACLEVAAQRAAELRACNADKAATRAIEGEPVPDPTPR